MAESVNEKKIKKELIAIYQKFLDENNREKAIKEAIAYDRIFGGLATEHYEKYISPKISEAISHLSTIYQYGMHDDDHPAFSNNKILEKAREVLKNLKEKDYKKIDKENLREKTNKNL